MKMLIAGLKFLGKALLAVVQGIAALVKKAGKLFQHPVVKVIIIACLLAAFATMATTVGPAAAMIAGPGRGLASRALKATTGKGLAGQALAGAGKVAKAAGKAAFGTDEEGQMLQEAEGLVEIADIIGELDADTIGAAIIKLASDLEGKEVWSTSAMHQVSSFTQKAGEAEEGFEKSTFLRQFADESLGLQSDALSNLKMIHQSMLQGEMDMYTATGGAGPAGWTKDLAKVMQSAVKVAANHCKEDPTACEGASGLAETVKQTWSGIVKSEVTAYAKETNKMISDFVEQTGSQVGADVVAPLSPEAGELADKLAMSQMK
jgi:hypothetical protein